MLTIAGYSDPYELWAAAETAPRPTPCEGILKNGGRCADFAQGGQPCCARHSPKPYTKPLFLFGAVRGCRVLYEEEYIPLQEAVAMLKVGGEIPVGSVLHLIRADEGAFPDNLQIVPEKVRTEALKQNHPPGEVIRWKEEGGVLRYSSTSVRLPAELLDHLDLEAARLGWSRNKTLEHYLLEGIKVGARPQSLTEQLRTASHG